MLMPPISNQFYKTVGRRRADYVNSRHFYGVEHEALDLLGKPEFPQTAKRRNTPSAPNCSLALTATVPTVVGDGVGSSLTSWTSSFILVGSSSTLVLMLEVAYGRAMSTLIVGNSTWPISLVKTA
uniref:Uncharacterized protein n=1 Tax=Glossina pallidipes TaxID=7398 RepID=A0A1A9ZRC2_GLOPL